MRAAGLLALACAVPLVALVGSGRDERGEPAQGQAGGLDDAVRELGVVEPATGPPLRVPGPRFAIAKVREGARVPLYEGPNGDQFDELGDETEFGSPRSFWIAKRRPGWFGVPVAELPNGRLAWIRDDPLSLELLRTPYFVKADLSERRVELHYGNRVLERFPVTVGRSGSPTPPGAYAITDGLIGDSVGAYYGCCVLALTGHQPNLPPDWIGGDRIAIHGTPGEIGLAASSGCLRASDADMVALFARVPLGTPVFIRA